MSAEYEPVESPDPNTTYSEKLRDCVKRCVTRPRSFVLRSLQLSFSSSPFSRSLVRRCLTAQEVDRPDIVGVASMLSELLMRQLDIVQVQLTVTERKLERAVSKQQRVRAGPSSTSNSKPVPVSSSSSSMAAADPNQNQSQKIAFGSMCPIHCLNGHPGSGHPGTGQYSDAGSTGSVAQPEQQQQHGDLLQAAQPVAQQEICISVVSSAASSMASSGVGSLASPNPNLIPNTASSNSNPKSRLPPRPPSSATALGGSAGPGGHSRLRSGRGGLNNQSGATATAAPASALASVARSPSPAIARAEDNASCNEQQQQPSAGAARVLRQQHSLSESESSQQPVTVQLPTQAIISAGDEAPLANSGSSASSLSPGSNSFPRNSGLRQPRQRSASPFPGPGQCSDSNSAEHSQNAGSSSISSYSQPRAMHVNGHLPQVMSAADVHAQCQCSCGLGAPAQAQPTVELRQHPNAALAAFKARSISMIAFDHSCASSASSTISQTVSVSQRRVREISDPMLELLGVAQRLVRLTQEPALEHSTRRVLLQRYYSSFLSHSLAHFLIIVHCCMFCGESSVKSACV